MTNPKNNAAQLAVQIARISAELEEANSDLALLDRLKSAQDRVTRLTADQTKALKERDQAIAAEAKAEKADRFARITNVRVVESGETLRESVLRSSWTIHWTKPTWDGRRANPLTDHSINGFGACPPDVLDYLIEICPQNIPAKIMALAPDTPRAAFGRYFRGLKRGFIQG